MTVSPPPHPPPPPPPPPGFAAPHLKHDDFEANTFAPHFGQR
eukprot:gene14622-25105_t